MGIFTSMALGAVALGGAAMSAAGQAKSGKAMSAADNYNASIYDEQAKAVEQAAEFDVVKQKRAAERLAGTQRADYAGAGVVQSGTPLAVELQSASEAEMDMMITKWNAKVDAAKLRSGAALQRQYGAMAETAGNTQAMGTLLSGATTAAMGFLPATKTATIPTVK